VRGVSKRLRNPCASSADSTETPRNCAMHNVDIARSAIGNSAEKRSMREKEPDISSPKKSPEFESTVRGHGSAELSQNARAGVPMASMRRNHPVTGHLVEKQGGVQSLDMARQVQHEFATSVLESFVAGCVKKSKPLPRSRRQYFSPLETSASKLEPSDAVALEARSLVISSSPVLRPGFSLIYGKKIQLFCRPRQPALMVRWVRSTRHAGILSNRAELINLWPTASRRIGCAASQRQVINCALAGNAC